MTYQDHTNPATGDLILANATLVLPDQVVRGSLRIRDGRIAGIDTGRAVSAGAVDCAGDMVAPGLIELHTDNLERHMQPRPGVLWPHAAAIVAHDAELAGVGITTVFDAMRVGSLVTTMKSRYRRYARGMANEILGLQAKGALRISHFLHLRAEVCSETLIEELDEFGPGDSVGIVSLMDHTPGQRQFRDMDKLRDYVCGKHGLSDEEFHLHVAQQKQMRARLGDRHEAAAVAAATRLGAILASHDDTTAGQVGVSSGHGVRFAEFPTTHEAASACRAASMPVMMGAPNLIRGGSHSGNVSAMELAEAGLLDMLSSDYAPAALLTGAVTLGRSWGDMARGIATVTDAPARTVRLADRGRLEEGLRADIIRFALIEDTPVVRSSWVAGARIA